MRRGGNNYRSKVFEEKRGNGIQCKVEGFSQEQMEGKVRGQCLCLVPFEERCVLIASV